MIVTDTTRRRLAFAFAPPAAYAAPAAAISEKPAVIPAPAKLDIAGASGFSLANGLPVVTAGKELRT